MPKAYIGWFAAALCLTQMTAAHAADRYVRVNQLAYAPSDPKIARILSHTDILGTSILVLHLPDSATVFSANTAASLGAWGSFAAVNPYDFSALATPGTYCLRVATTHETSPSFVIDAADSGGVAYGALASPLLQFFRYQRCGATGPLLHNVCHLLDASKIIGGPDNGRAVACTGGWHDAGDYIKFLVTESYAVELLLLADETRPGLCGDADANGVSDILDEAAVGVRHLLTLRYAPSKFLYQVQGTADHNVPPRLPENDPLAANRPAYYGVSKAHLGRYAAALARAARAYASINPALADSCKTAALDAYATVPSVPDLVATEFYGDTEYADKLGLAAIELYLTTGLSAYLTDAQTYSAQAGAAYWFGWDTVTDLLNVLLAPYSSAAQSLLDTDVSSYAAAAALHPFGMCATETWGSNAAGSGEAAMILLHEHLTGSHAYASAAFGERDFLLGANAWGASMVGGQGLTAAHDFHHQVAGLVNGGALPGAVSEGPAPSAVIVYNGIVLRDPDEYAEFQTSHATWHDDRADYVCNEPTLDTNAGTLLLVALLAARPEGLTTVRAPVTPHDVATLRATVLPRRGVEFTLTPAGTIANQLVLRDVRGRCIARCPALPDGAGSLHATWNGHVSSGGLAPGGVYVATLAGATQRVLWNR